MTKEEILNRAYAISKYTGIIPDDKRVYNKKLIFKAMEEYAQEQVKNCSIPVVSVKDYEKLKNNYELLNNRYDSKVKYIEKLINDYDLPIVKACLD